MANRHCVAIDTTKACSLRKVDLIEAESERYGRYAYCPACGKLYPPGFDTLDIMEESLQQLR